MGGGVIFWPLFLLAVTPLVLATPAHATGGNTDNTVSLTVDKEDVELKQSPTKYLHKATTAVTVDPAPLSGFNLTIHAKDADLVNDKNSSYRIKGMDKDPYGLLLGMNEKTNLWGYRVEEGPGAADRQDKFLHTPGGTNEKPNVIVDTASEHDNAGCKGKNQCTVHVTFGASLDLTKLPAGKYSTEVTYTATAKPAPKPTYTDWVNRTAKTDPSDICRSGDKNSSCLVDLDPSMIPVKYNTETAAWKSVADPEAADSDWYNYGNKQWANAVTVVNPQDYKGQAKPIKQSDILGFWVYIPRYRYKVLRFSPKDPAVPAQNFEIEFENKDSKKAIPTATGDWATHPAFTFGTKELNGIWFAKFETTGTNTQPTVLPNERHIEGYNSGLRIGGFYTVAKSLGVNDPNNVGGNSVTTNQNAHHLAKLSSHMVNNNDWGAATYLSASKYGAGYNGVQINANGAKRNSDIKSWGTTGCGPQSNGNTGYYSDSGTLGTPQACGNADRAYNGTLGQLASTTNNPTGIYDMSGGGWEYVAASYTTNLNESGVSDQGNYFGTKAHPPYVNTYNFSDPNSCTFSTCGGQALYETNNGINNSSTAQWNGNYMYFVTSSYPWFYRGGYYSNGSNAGLFSTNDLDGYGYYGGAFRVALVSALKD